MNHFIIRVANIAHVKYAEQICLEIESSAKARGTGIARRTPEFIVEKILKGQAVIATHTDGRFAGFCYIESWDHGEYAVNSGLIVSPEFRNCGLAKNIKKQIFELSRALYPNAKIFGLTTGLPVMKINSELGYEPVTYSELTRDESFWSGCKSCVNYEILQSRDKKNCLCTAMLFDPSVISFKKPKRKFDFVAKRKVAERLIKMKQSLFLKFKSKTDNTLTVSNESKKE